MISLLTSPIASGLPARKRQAGVSREVPPCHGPIEGVLRTAGQASSGTCRPRRLRSTATLAVLCLLIASSSGAAEPDLETLRESCKLHVLERTAPCALQVVKFEVLGATAESISEDSAIDFIERAASAWDEQQHVDSVVALSSALAVPADRLPGMWVSGALRQDGFKSRKTFEPGVVPGAGSSKSDAVVDGLTQVYYNDYSVGTGQVSFFERAGWSWDRPSDLFPNVAPLDSIVSSDEDSGIVVCESPSGRVRFHAASRTIESVDRRPNDTFRVYRRFADYIKEHSPVAGPVLDPPVHRIGQFPQRVRPHTDTIPDRKCAPSGESERLGIRHSGATRDDGRSLSARQDAGFSHDDAIARRPGGCAELPSDVAREGSATTLEDD
ncbi:hypothetical protein Mal4_39200 [Maioricimonas rarisocia]|uniref:Uncharacterized protein n=1 Tax=Maioricimonas rarisocia TaxID=2528026 RepID=A0A517ZAN8_9PLAN|nr:hypothetical protein [Maioricimonas rarisocia]QDU39575.1 hypothetical protein Mal4_39200 [Maioricimonas rarisocia]